MVDGLQIAEFMAYRKQLPVLVYRKDFKFLDPHFAIIVISEIKNRGLRLQPGQSCRFSLAAKMPINCPIPVLENSLTGNIFDLDYQAGIE